MKIYYLIQQEKVFQSKKNLKNINITLMIIKIQMLNLGILLKVI